MSKSEFAWVIEIGDTSRPLYWTGRDIQDFTTSNERALRFAREEDAETVKRYLVQPNVLQNCRVVEHGWGSE